MAINQQQWEYDGDIWLRNVTGTMDFYDFQ